MAGICTDATSPNSCSHYVVTVDLDGTPVTLTVGAAELLDPLSSEERALFMRLALRRLRQTGVPLSAMVRRVVQGDEATNVKIYDFFGPGAAITKPNIGTSYVNIPLGANGERIVVDLTGCTEYRLVMHANLVGSGPWGARVVRDGDTEVLFEQANLGAGGERELDTDWQTLPAAFLGQGLTVFRIQAKSTTPQDDPIFRGARIGVR